MPEKSNLIALAEWVSKEVPRYVDEKIRVVEARELPEGPRGLPGADGAGVVRTRIVDGNLITEYTDGRVLNAGRVVGDRGADGVPGRNGVDGQPGATIDAVEVDERGHLVIYMTDGRQIDAGPIKGNGQTLIRRVKRSKPRTVKLSGLSQQIFGINEGSIVTIRDTDGREVIIDVRVQGAVATITSNTDMSGLKAEIAAP